MENLENHTAEKASLQPLMAPPVALTTNDMAFMIDQYRRNRTTEIDKTLSCYFSDADLTRLTTTYSDAKGVRIYYGLHYTTSLYAGQVDNSCSYDPTSQSYEGKHTLIICPVTNDETEVASAALVGSDLMEDEQFTGGPIPGGAGIVPVVLTPKDFPLMIAMYMNYRTPKRDGTLCCFYPMADFKRFVDSYSKGKGIRIFYGLHYSGERALHPEAHIDNDPSYDPADAYDDHHTLLLSEIVTEEEFLEAKTRGLMKPRVAVIGALMDGGSLCPPKSLYNGPGYSQPALMRAALSNFSNA